MSDYTIPDDWEEPKFSEEERESFRWRLEALLNGVLRIQRMAQREEPCEFIQRNRIDLCRQAAKLIGDICGDWVKLTENDSDTPLGFVAFSLRVWQPVLDMQDEYSYFWEDLIDEIERLPYGDEPELLRPAVRNRGEHSQPARIAQCRLAALQWAKFLKSKQIRPKQYKQEICLAFGPDWETIRKWQNSVERTLGAPSVAWRLEAASEGYGLSFEFPDYHRALHYYGAHYRRVAGLGEIDFSVFSKAIGGIESA